MRDGKAVMDEAAKRNEYCDFSCPYADFPKDQGVDGAGSCRTFAAVWCRLLGRYAAKNAPCAARTSTA